MSRSPLIPYPEMILVPAGPFLMGSDFGPEEEKPVHPVMLDTFWMDEHPITNLQFKAFLKACPQWQKTAAIKTYMNNYYLYFWREETIFPSGKRDHPVVYVSWYSAAAYCNWRSRQENLLPCYDEKNNFACDVSATGYRLPTEAEYEYASRGGIENFLYPWGDKIDKSVANYDNIVGDTTEVKTYQPNNLGLYDMSGNIGHWCQDWFGPDYYAHSPESNPQGPEIGQQKIYRGGTWGTQEHFHRCASRNWQMPNNVNPDFGFRCVRKA